MLDFTHTPYSTTSCVSWWGLCKNVQDVSAAAIRYQCSTSEICEITNCFWKNIGFFRQLDVFLNRAYSAVSLFGGLRAYSANFELIRQISSLFGMTSSLFGKIQPLNTLTWSKIAFAEYARAYSAIELIRSKKCEKPLISVELIRRKYWPMLNTLYQVRWIRSFRKGWVCTGLSLVIFLPASRPAGNH